MSLSPEMTRYITTGRCPHCDVEILSTAYVFQNKESLQRAAYDLASWRATNIILFNMSASIVAPSGVRAKVKVVRAEVMKPHAMQCLACMRSWTPLPSVSSARTDLFKQLTSGSQDWTRSSKEPTLFQPKTPAPGLRFTPSPPPRQVDLSRCRLLDVTEERKVEEFLREERKTYRNNSSATITQTITITSSITRTVTIESTKLKSHSEGAGIALVRFASIQGQIQRQLSERYTVTLQSTSSVSEETSASILPYSTIEHIIRWKTVTWVGTALLGKPARLPQPVAEIPYEVLLGLTFESEFINVHDVPGKKKKPS